MAQDAGLVVVSALFAYFHAAHVVVDGSYTSLFFAVEQAVLVVIFLSRRRSTATSTRPYDWMTATLGGWLPLATRPVGEGIGLATVFGSLLQVAGLSLTIVAFLTIGRSFGVVAANRGLKVHGPYRFVRHPIYVSHTVTQVGFLVANYHPLNLTLLAVVWICQLLRIRAEERVLTETADYTAYRQRVRWRLIPGIY
jgi:hypothetical protein